MDGKTPRDYIDEFMEKSEKIFKERRKIEHEINKLQKKLMETRYQDIVDDLAPLFAGEIIKKLNGYSSYDILGPFGLSNHVSIHFYKDDVPVSSRYNIKGGVLSITFRPIGSNIKIVDYSNDSGEYPKGSIGEINYFNFDSVPVPETFNEMVEFIKRSKDED